MQSGCREESGCVSPRSCSGLVKMLGVSSMVVELGVVPYRQLHQLYARADVYVTPAYTETFAHPLVEAMASGLPVVASDLPVHREICWGGSGLFPDVLGRCIGGNCSASRAVAGDIETYGCGGSRARATFFVEKARGKDC